MIWTTNVVLLYRAVNSNIYAIIIRYIASYPSVLKHFISQSAADQ